ELLELAARAAGIKARWFKVAQWRQVGGNRMKTGQDDVFGTHHRKPWNPRDDDGDALRLAVTRGLVVTPDREILSRTSEALILQQFTPTAIT
ncbi:hypothetical protein ABVN79_006719, partial [Pseudomonas aeruginosa]